MPGDPDRFDQTPRRPNIVADFELTGAPAISRWE